MARARRTADHDEIREWVESRGGRPAIVEGTEGLLRIDFDEPDPTLEETDWDTFFRIFDESNVDFLYNPDGGMVKFVESTTPVRSAARRGAPRKSSGRKKSAGRKKSSGRKKSTSSRKKSTSSRKKSTTSRKKSTSSRKKSTTSRKKSSDGRKKSSGRKKSTSGRKKSSNGRKKSSGRKKSTNGRKKSSGRKYGKKAQKKVGRVMHEYKHGSLKSGRSGRKVKNRKQAIAIGISEARREGDKVPSRGRKKSSGRKKRS